jgi:hypothetical protein
LLDKNVISVSPFKNLNISATYPTEVYSDDYFLNPALLASSNLGSTVASGTFSTFEDSYENTKSSNNLFINSSKIKLNFVSNFFLPYSYSFIFDCFRSDFEEHA